MKILTAVALSAIATLASADEFVPGYIRQDGTYVQPHYRSTPNNTRLDNYSTQGNTNPYTGQRGYENPYQPPRQQPMYGSPPPRQNRGGGYVP